MFKYLLSGWVLIALSISPAQASNEKMGNPIASDGSAFALQSMVSPEQDMRMAQVSGVPNQPMHPGQNPNRAMKQHNRQVKKQMRRQAIAQAIAPHAVPGVTPPLPWMQPHMGPLPGHLYGSPAPVPGAPFQLYALPYHRTLPVLRDNPYHCTQIIGWSNSGMVPPGWPPNVFYSEVDYCQRVYYVTPTQGVPAPPPAAVPSPPPPPSQYSADDMACRDLASRAAGNAADRAAEGAIVGGLFGAATGAAIGAAAGDPASGAAIGGAVGATSGAARGSMESSAEYQRAYQNCMRSRGH